MARIVFDLDGTLIDSAPEIRAIVNGLLQDRDLPPLSLEQVIGFIGNGAGVLLAKVSAARQIPDTDHAQLLAQFEQRYARPNGMTRPYPGAVQVLQQLRAQGHQIGLCTNKPILSTQAVLNDLGLSALFDQVTGGNSLPQRKPHPAPLLQVLAELGEAPAIYVGDSEVDAETAARAGVRFVLFTRGYRHRPVEDLPHAAQFDDFAQLPALIDRLLATGGDDTAPPRADQVIRS